VPEQPLRFGGATEAQRRAGRDQLQIGRVASVACGLELRDGACDRLRAPAQIAERERDLRFRREAARAEQTVDGPEGSQRRSKLRLGAREFAELRQRPYRAWPSPAHRSADRAISAPRARPEKRARGPQR